MFQKNQGKILKIKSGYNPNCSSGSWALLYFLLFGAPVLGAIILVSTSHLIARTLYKRHIAKSETYEKGSI